ncbi:MAG: glycine cleavage system protein GcvH [Thermodesulfobacteriota bacterium]|jgi:glycine cleavage system H protein
MEIPEDLYYTREHLWLRVMGNRGKIGITDYAQLEMGEIVFLNLPEENAPIEQGEVFGTLESAKTVADLYAPVSGEILSNNKDIEEEPSLINDDPYGNGWLVMLEMDEPSQLEELLSASEYEIFLEKKEKGQQD